MAEQFLRAYNINIEDLYGIVGSKKKSFIKSAKKNKYQAKEVNTLIKESGKPIEGGVSFGLDNALEDIIMGSLDKKRVYQYMRTVELLLEVEGTLLKGEVIFPGRGWQDTGPYFSSIGLPRLGQFWCNENLPFPWKKEEVPVQPDWPMSMVIKNQDVPKLKQELENFDLRMLQKYLLPERQEGLEGEIEAFIEIFKNWLKESDKDVVLLLDGQQ